MSLWDRLKKKPRYLWTDEEKEAHCEQYAENFAKAWNCSMRCSERFAKSAMPSALICRLFTAGLSSFMTVVI